MTDGDDWGKDWQRRFQKKGAKNVAHEADCSLAADDELLRGIGAFNDGNWFVCHELLEDLWVGEAGEVKYLYQGILQVAVALHHWQNGNYRGAMLLFDSGVRLLRHVEPHCREVDVAALIASTERVKAALEALGEEDMEHLDRSLIPAVRMEKRKADDE